MPDAGSRSTGYESYDEVHEGCPRVDHDETRAQQLTLLRNPQAHVTCRKEVMAVKPYEKKVQEEQLAK
jgi:hypothetical protein